MLFTVLAPTIAVAPRADRQFSSISATLGGPRGILELPYAEPRRRSYHPCNWKTTPQIPTLRESPPRSAPSSPFHGFNPLPPVFHPLVLEESIASLNRADPTRAPFAFIAMHRLWSDLEKRMRAPPRVAYPHPFVKRLRLRGGHHAATRRHAVLGALAMTRTQQSGAPA